MQPDDKALGGSLTIDRILAVILAGIGGKLSPKCNACTLAAFFVSPIPFSQFATDWAMSELFSEALYGGIT